MKRYRIAHQGGAHALAMDDGRDIELVSIYGQDMYELICLALNQYDPGCTLGALIAAQQAEAEPE